MIDSIQLTYPASGVKICYHDMSDNVLNLVSGLYEPWNDSNYVKYNASGTTQGHAQRWEFTRPGQVTIPFRSTARATIDGTPSGDVVVGAGMQYFPDAAPGTVGGPPLNNGNIRVNADTLSLPQPPPSGYGAGSSAGTGSWPVTILVTSDGTTPIVGATVRLWDGGTQSRYATTGAGGTVGFSVNPGTYTIAVVAAGYQFAPISDTVNGSGQWGSNSSNSRTITMTLMVPQSVPLNPNSQLTMAQLTGIFKNFGKLIYTAQLASANASVYEEHLTNLNTEFANNANSTDGGLSYNVLFNWDMNFQTIGGGIVSQENAGITAVKNAMDTYLLQLAALVGAKPSDTATTVASLLAGNMVAATGYVQPSGGLDALHSFSAYFGQNYSVTLPQNMSPTFPDSWITTTIV